MIQTKELKTREDFINLKKGDVIFKITSEMCGKTIKLSEFTK